MEEIFQRLFFCHVSFPLVRIFVRCRSRGREAHAQQARNRSKVPETSLAAMLWGRRVSQPSRTSWAALVGRRKIAVDVAGCDRRMPEGHRDLVDSVDDVACNIETGYARALVGVCDEIPSFVERRAKIDRGL
ncbi:hypothetical protein EN750_14165 [Mesorhizobium sp. M7A.F.Ca.ET.027.03.2.1]|nr:hypothetical protein EN750_14165 [Mesorhizobium sp. M7A.F.Ca.ET.027.03.2.1]